MNTRTIDRTYHDAVKNKEDDSRAGIPNKEGAIHVHSDLLPDVQVSAFAKIDNEFTGRCTYEMHADAYAFTLNGIDYWNATLHLSADDERQTFLSWRYSNMNRAHGDHREAPARAREVVMQELRRAIMEVWDTPDFHERARADAYRRRIKEYEDTIIDRYRRIDHLTTLLDPETADN